MSTHVIPNGTVKTEPVDSNSNSSMTPVMKTEQEVKSETPRTKVSPSHKLSLTGPQCMVCGDLATSESGFRRHYGVICCEACKCFFRRTVQMSRDYKCRFGGKCTVGRTAVNLKQICQACRFNQCLKAGMKIDSVKKFPRKMREDSSAKRQRKQAKVPKDKQTPTPSDSNVNTSSNGTDYNASASSPQSGKSESDIEEFSQLKFNVASPETLLFLENTNVPQLFNYGSLENIHRDSGGSPALSRSTNGDATEDVKPALVAATSLTNIAASANMVRPVSKPNSPEPAPDALRPNDKETYFFPPTVSPVNWSANKGQNAMQNLDHLSIPSGRIPYAPPISPSKRPRIESSSSTIDMMSYHSSPGSHYNSHSAPHTPLLHPHSQPSSRVNSPDPGMSSVYNSHNNTPFATPSHTPAHSPLPSPTSHNTHFISSQNPYSSNINSHPGSIRVPSSTNQIPALNSQQFAPPSAMGQLAIPGFSSPNNLLALQQPSGNTILLQNSQMPFGMAGMAPLFPVVQFASPFSPSALSLNEQSRLHSTRMDRTEDSLSQGSFGGEGGSNLRMSSGKSPFTIVPIPSINKTQPPEEPECAEVSQISRDAEVLGGGEGMMSAPPSARSSPVTNKPKSRASLPEANVEEVLESLRLRIRSMFKWAKSEVAGFDDLSPLDQKALLRKTVAELVMLGFARGSIAYENVLLLGSTGAVIVPSNPNSGIASVASVTLEKLVVPLKVLNISDKELRLLKEVVLFNPEANGLRNREIVRQYRKRKHIELMEYTDKNSDDPGRFGDLMCLLTPLFEVGLEVTEQLRLEQFVHEGEARIDALLLMSMISGAEEMPAESTVDQ